MDFLKRNNDANNFREPSPPQSGFLWNLLRILFLVFVALLLAYGGLKFGYTPFLNRQIDKSQSDIDALATQIPQTSQDQFLSYYFQLLDLKTLLAKHVFVSKTFPFLENNTNKSVFWSNATLSVPEHRLTLDGVALSYVFLTEQLEAFRQAPQITHFTLSNASADKTGRVQFSVTLTLAPQLFK